MERTTGTGWKQLLGLTAMMVLGVAATGCQIDVAGQTLPSAYYRTDDIQYFPKGPEFKLTNEAAAMRAYRAQQQLGDE